MLLSLAPSGAEWWDDHHRGISQVGRGANTGHQKVYSISFLEREWEWESEISDYGLLPPQSLLRHLRGGPHRSQSGLREPRSER
jgi:hypothetical protein